MQNTSTKFAKVTAGMEGLTSVVGAVIVATVLTQVDYSEKENYVFLILSLLTIPYALAAFWLWKGEKKGFILSLLMTGFAIVDIDTELFSFYLSNGFYLNVGFGSVQIDIWSLLIFIFLIVLAFTGYRVEPVAGGDATR